MKNNKFSLFSNRRFVIIWGGQTVSGIGDRLLSLALMWWVVQETGSGAAMSATALAVALPRILLGPVSGVLADRINRRTLMMLSNLINAVVTIAVAFLFWQGTFSLNIIIAASAAIGVVGTFHIPAFEATIPAIVKEEELVRANSLMQTSHSLIGIVAPALSGIIIAVAGVGVAIVVDAVTFLVAGLSLLLVKLPPPIVQANRQRVMQDITTGFKFIFQHSLLLPMLILFSVVNLTMAPMGITIPLLITQVLMAGPALLGLFGSAHSAGVLLGSLVLSSFPRLVRRTGIAVLGSIVGIGVLVAVLGAYPSYIGLIGISFCLGLVAVVANISVQTIWQREVPADVRGRVFSARHTLSVGLQPLGMAAAGIFVDMIGVQQLLVIAGILCSICALAGFSIRQLATYTQAPILEKPDAKVSV